MEDVVVIGAGRKAQLIPFPLEDQFDSRLLQRFPSFQHKHGDRYYTKDALCAMSFGFDLAASDLYSEAGSGIEYQHYLDQNGIDPNLVMSLKTIRKECFKQIPIWTKSESGMLLYKGFEIPPAEEIYQEIVSAIKSLPREQRTFKNVLERLRQNKKEIRRDIVELFFIKPQQSNTAPTAAPTEAGPAAPAEAGTDQSVQEELEGGARGAALVQRHRNNQQNVQQMLQIGATSVPVTEQSINAFMAASAVHYPAQPPSITFVSNNNDGTVNFGPVTHQQQATLDPVLAALGRIERGQGVLLSRTVDRRVPSSAVRSSIGRAARETNGHDLHQMELFPDSGDSPNGSAAFVSNNNNNNNSNENNRGDEEDGKPPADSANALDSRDAYSVLGSRGTNHIDLEIDANHIDLKTDANRDFGSRGTNHMDVETDVNRASGMNPRVTVETVTSDSEDEEAVVATSHDTANGGSRDTTVGESVENRDEELTVGESVENRDEESRQATGDAAGVAGTVFVETVTSASEDDAEDGVDEDLDADAHVETSWSRVPVLPPLQVTLPPAEVGRISVVQNLLQLVVEGDGAAQLAVAARNAGYGVTLNTVFVPWKEALAIAAWEQAMATQLETSTPQYPHSVPSRSVQDVARRYAVSRVIPMKIGVRLSLDAEIATLQQKIQALELASQSHTHRNERNANDADLHNLKMQLAHLRWEQSYAQATTPAVAEKLKQQFARADKAHKKLKLLYDFICEAENPDFISDLLGEFDQAILLLAALDAMTWQGLQLFLDRADPVIAFLGPSNDIAIYCSDILLDGDIEGLLLPLIGFSNQVCIEVSGTSNSISVTVAWKPTEEAFRAASQVVESILRTALAHATIEDGRQARGRGRHRRSVVQISCETKSNKKGALPLSSQQLGSLAFNGQLSFRSSSFTMEQQGILDEQGVVQQQVGLAFAANSITLEDCHLDEGGSRLAQVFCSQTFVQDVKFVGRCCLADPALLHLINNLSDAGSSTNVHFHGGALADFIRSEQAIRAFMKESVKSIKVGVSRLRCFVMDAEHSASIESRLSAALISTLKSKTSTRAFNHTKASFLDLEEDNIPFCLTGGPQDIEHFVASLHGRIEATNFKPDGCANATITNEVSDGLSDPSKTELGPRSDEKENEEEKGTKDALGENLDPHKTTRLDETKNETGSDVGGEIKSEDDVSEGATSRSNAAASNANAATTNEDAAEVPRRVGHRRERPALRPRERSRRLRGLGPSE